MTSENNDINKSDPISVLRRLGLANIDCVHTNVWAAGCLIEADEIIE